MAPKILLFDIETSPILSYVWQLWDQNVGLNQIVNDWHILSWAAKWYKDPKSKMMYQDQRNVENVEDDKDLCRGIWSLLDEADIVITQNGKAFDAKKLNARFIMHGFQPPKSYRHIDTKQLAKKHFAFTSNKLEYMTDKLCKTKKLKHKKYAGFELWKECLAGNQDAWKEMERYNKYDVLSLEELYSKFAPWDNSINMNVYNDEAVRVCSSCGSDKLTARGYQYTNGGKYHRLKCKECGYENKSKMNLFNKEKRANL